MISVLVVDDSAVVRRVVTDALAEDAGIKVVGTAANGRIALTKIEQLAPDLITLDIEMPVMDGLETLRALRRIRPKLPVIMFSTLTEVGASATFTALSLGASDYVTKPSNTGSFAASRRSVQEQLIPRIHALCRQPVLVAPPVPPAAAPARLPATRIELVAIGSSTGGPDALTKLISGLPATFPVPIVVVQHMPPVFTRMFAQRLDRVVPMQVVESTDGVPVQAGCVYIAPGDHHLEVVRRGTATLTRLHSGPPENFCRPAVDVLFRSVATAYGGSALAVVLTGMGHDGQLGCEPLHAAGAQIVAQDQATSVVWGMPGSIVSAGLADTVLPLERIGPHLVNRAAQGRGAQPKAVVSWR